MNVVHERNMSEKELWWYLDTRRFGTAPHSGFGLGFERLLLFASLGLSVWALCSIPSSRPVRAIDFVAFSNRLVSATRPVASSNVPPLVVRDSFRYFPASSNMPAHVIFGDRFIRIGVPCEFGFPSLISSDYVFGTGFDGRDFHLVPSDRRLPSSLNPVVIRVVH